MLVDKKLDLGSLEYLKRLACLSGNALLVRDVFVGPKPTSLYVWSEKNRTVFDTYTTKTCFVCSTILHIESTMLNLKLRLKFNRYRFFFYSFGFYTDSAFGASFGTLHLKNFLLLIKSKNIAALTSLCSVKHAILIVGESLAGRINQYSDVVLLLACKLPLLVLYLNSKFVGLESSKALRIKLLSKRIFRRITRLIPIVAEAFLDSTIEKFGDARHTRLVSAVTAAPSKVGFYCKKQYLVEVAEKSSGIYLNCEQTVVKTTKLVAVKKLVVQDYLVSTLRLLKTGISTLRSCSKFFSSKNCSNRLFFLLFEMLKTNFLDVYAVGYLSFCYRLMSINLKSYPDRAISESGCLRGSPLSAPLANSLLAVRRSSSNFNLISSARYFGTFIEPDESASLRMTELKWKKQYLIEAKIRNKDHFLMVLDDDAYNKAFLKGLAGHMRCCSIIFFCEHSCKWNTLRATGESDSKLAQCRHEVAQFRSDLEMDSDDHYIYTDIVDQTGTRSHPSSKYLKEMYILGCRRQYIKDATLRNKYHRSMMADNGEYSKAFTRGLAGHIKCCRIGYDISFLYK